MNQHAPPGDDKQGSLWERFKQDSLLDQIGLLFALAMVALMFAAGIYTLERSAPPGAVQKGPAP